MRNPISDLISFVRRHDIRDLSDLLDVLMNNPRGEVVSVLTRDEIFDRYTEANLAGHESYFFLFQLYQHLSHHGSFSLATRLADEIFQAAEHATWGFPLIERRVIWPEVQRALEPIIPDGEGYNHVLGLLRHRMTRGTVGDSLHS